MTVIKLRLDNPYRRGTINTYQVGNPTITRKPINYRGSVDDRLHIIVDGDTLPLLSFNYYGSAKWWWLIADANKISETTNITTGSSIIIPDFITITSLYR